MLIASIMPAPQRCDIQSWLRYVIVIWEKQMVHVGMRS